MIAYLEGNITYKSPALIYLEVNGVGYEVQISLNTYASIQHLQQCKLLTFLHIKEDAHTLYGFYEETEKMVFLLLLSVSGVGAATARMILSSMPPEEIQKAIVQEDERLLEKVKGIGAKTAKRIILELKDKIIRQKDNIQIKAKMYNTIQDDALNALVVLGINRNAAEQAVNKILKQEPQLQNLEELIKKALKNM
jgi:holliday junction DNA helicase RuvA